MNKKIVGIFVMALLIATVFSGLVKVTNARPDDPDEPGPFDVQIQGPHSADVGESVHFGVIKINGNSPYSYYWTFDDGGTSTSSSPDHTWYYAGQYTITVSVTDDDGDVATDDHLIVITDPALKAIPTIPSEGYVGEEIHFYGSATGGDSPYSWWWSFGDGQYSDEQNPTHVYTSIDTYTVCLKVTDNQGDTDTECDTISIIEYEPDYELHVDIYSDKFRYGPRDPVHLTVDIWNDPATDDSPQAMLVVICNPYFELEEYNQTIPSLPPHGHFYRYITGTPSDFGVYNVTAIVYVDGVAVVQDTCTFWVGIFDGGSGLKPPI